MAVAQTRLPAADEPFWAWGWNDATTPRPAAAPRNDAERQTSPGSTLSVTRGEINNYNFPDWYPGDHPPMPPIVAKGDMARGINACSFCHLPNGHGRPENGNISGLPVEYFIQQSRRLQKRRARDIRSAQDQHGKDDRLRQEPDRRRDPTGSIYFAAIKQDANWVKVVEAATVPKIDGTGNWLTVIEGAGAGTEPIGNRIVETPVAPEEQEKWRNPRSGFIAYVRSAADRQGKGAGETGGNGTFHRVHGLPRPGPAWPWAGAAAGRAVAELHRAGSSMTCGTATAPAHGRR